MQNENYSRYVIIGLVLTLVLVASLGVAFIAENGRLAKVSAAEKKAQLLYGRQLYVDNCTSCHGTRGEGGVGAVLNNKTLLQKASDDVLYAAIVAGRPSTVMPAWGQAYGGPFTDEDIRSLVSFIRAWEPTAPVVQAAVYTPSPVRGATLFSSLCVVCHGENAKGAKAPAFNTVDQFTKYDDPWFRQVIMSGRPVKGMPAYGAILSANQLDDVMALIDAWRKGEDVKPGTTVAEYINSALFSLNQGDKDDALFYLQHAKAIAFGPGAERVNQIIDQLSSGQPDQALSGLQTLAKDWPIGDATNGKTVYTDNCKSCHGDEGQGGVGKKLKPNQFVQDTANADLMTFLLTGRSGTAMRGFDGRLNESQLADVIAFLRSWQK